MCDEGVHEEGCGEEEGEEEVVLVRHSRCRPFMAKYEPICIYLKRISGPGEPSARMVLRAWVTLWLWLSLGSLVARGVYAAGNTSIVAGVSVSGSTVPVGNMSSSPPNTPVNTSLVMDLNGLLTALQRAGIPAPAVYASKTGGVSVEWVNTTVAARACLPGYFSPTGLGRCSACPSGTFNDGIEIGACTRCPTGTFGSGLGSVGQSVGCTPCPAGTFSGIMGANSSSACVACPSGYSSPMGSDMEAACILPVDTVYAQTLSTATLVGAVAGGGVAVVMLGTAVLRPILGAVGGGVPTQAQVGKLRPSPLLAVKIDAWPLNLLGGYEAVPLHSPLRPDKSR